MKYIAAALSIILMGPASGVCADDLTDTQIRKLLIQQSIASYSGNCPCPYNTMRNGRKCGGNSAYSKPGGAQPLCYEHDVSDEAVKRYRATKQP